MCKYSHSYIEVHMCDYTASTLAFSFCLFRAFPPFFPSLCSSFSLVLFPPSYPPTRHPSFPLFTPSLSSTYRRIPHFFLSSLFSSLPLTHPLSLHPSIPLPLSPASREIPSSFLIFFSPSLLSMYFPSLLSSLNPILLH